MYYPCCVPANMTESVLDFDNLSASDFSPTVSPLRVRNRQLMEQSPDGKPTPPVTLSMKVVKAN